MTAAVSTHFEPGETATTDDKAEHDGTIVSFFIIKGDEVSEAQN